MRIKEKISEQEVFVSRFSRLSDIFFSRGLRLLERLKLEETGSIKDRLNHAEKWDIVDACRGS